MPHKGVRAMAIEDFILHIFCSEERSYSGGCGRGSAASLRF
jgi:hypothetical protein